MEARLKRIARRQHGLVTRQQAMVEVSAEAVRTALRRGDLELVVPGVYRVGGMPSSWRQSVMAEVLATGTGAVASHKCAAALWGLSGFPSGPVEVTVLYGKHHPPGVHQTRVLDPIDVTTIDRIPVTRVARTLFDLAGTVSLSRLEDALCRRLVTLNRLSARNDALKARGRANLDAVLDLWTEGKIPDTVAEARLVRRLVAHGLPAPERQVWIGNYRVDLLYRAANLIIELDSFRWHEVRRGRKRTRERRNDLTIMGYTMIEADVDDVRTDGGEICRQVRAILYSSSSA